MYYLEEVNELVRKITNFSSYSFSHGLLWKSSAFVTYLEQESGLAIMKGQTIQEN